MMLLCVLVGGTGMIAGNGTADVTVDEYHRYKVSILMIHPECFFCMIITV
jgi:hypothetical protein